MRSLRLILSAVLLLGSAMAQEITTPEKFFGFQLGADKKMARWDKIVEYYGVLEKQSGGRMKVINMGPTSMGNPFLMVIITSPANFAKLERLREVNLRLSDPRGLTEAQAHALVDEGKAVVVQSMSMHATEIGGTQMAPELAYDLLARKDEETRRILDNVIFIEVPCFNPDGEIMVTDWYNKQLGTPYEGTNPPWLYQKYAGHDNNRDAFQTNIPDSQYMAQHPVHRVEARGLRGSPRHGRQRRAHLPAAVRRAGAALRRPDPLARVELVRRAHGLQRGRGQSLRRHQRRHLFRLGPLRFPLDHALPQHRRHAHRIGRARLASPQFMHPDQLRGNTRNLPVYEAETIFPNPWPGGWWHLRDIVERQKVSAWATLDLAARNRETVLWNAYLKGKRQTERGAAGKPAAYLISSLQHDPLTSIKMVNKLLVQGIEIQRATKAFTTAQRHDVSRGLVRRLHGAAEDGPHPLSAGPHLLSRTTSGRANRDGSPIRPYDMATDTMFEYMGVRVDPVDELGEVALEKVAGPIEPAGKVTRGPNGYSMDGRLNDSFRAMNLLFDKGVAVRRVDKPSAGLRAGDFVVAAGSEAVLETVARQTGVDFTPLRGAVSTGVHDMKRQRVAMYQRFGGGNIDEGWTRLVLEQFNFPYTSIFDPEIKAGNLIDKYDVLVIPNDTTATITGEAPARRGPAGRGGRGGGGGAAPARGGRGAAAKAEAAADAAATLRPSTAPVSAPKASTPSATSSRRAARW